MIFLENEKFIAAEKLNLARIFIVMIVDWNKLVPNKVREVMEFVGSTLIIRSNGNLGWFDLMKTKNFFL